MRAHTSRWLHSLVVAIGIAVIGIGLASVVFADSADAATATGHWVWPLSDPIHVLRGFEPPSGPYSAGHRGVDLATTVGETVRAAGSGVVTFAGVIGGTPMVTVMHGALRTTYQPITPSVDVGQPVAAGQAIGAITIAPTHCGLVPSCLHWGLLRGSTYLDPLTLVGSARVRLLPHLQLGAPTSGVQTLAIAPGSGADTTRSSAARSAAVAATNSSTTGSPSVGHALLASAGVASGAALAFRVTARRRRRRWL
jgi:murein DD-endopeptidase MepM/ murein hydrolase activator NlpD